MNNVARKTSTFISQVLCFTLVINFIFSFRRTWNSNSHKLEPAVGSLGHQMSRVVFISDTHWLGLWLEGILTAHFGRPHTPGEAWPRPHGRFALRRVAASHCGSLGHSSAPPAGAALPQHPGAQDYMPHAETPIKRNLKNCDILHLTLRKKPRRDKDLLDGQEGKVPNPAIFIKIPYKYFFRVH